MLSPWWNAISDDNLSVIFSYNLYIVFIYICMTLVYFCLYSSVLHVCITSTMNKYMNKYMNMFVSTMNNTCTMYLHYV